MDPLCALTFIFLLFFSFCCVLLHIELEQNRENVANAMSAPPSKPKQGFEKVGGFLLTVLRVFKKGIIAVVLAMIAAWATCCGGVEPRFLLKGLEMIFNFILQLVGKGQLPPQPAPAGP